MSRLFTFLLVYLVPLTALSQEKVITGTVVEGSSNTPIEYATIILYNSTNDELIATTATDVLGKFKLTTQQDSTYLEVSFIGFKKRELRKLLVQNNKINVGTISLEATKNQLDNIVVQGERSQTVFKLDKREFIVGKDLSSTGASALEVLDNVPSVNVNIEGQITLRGSEGAQILINGKPSILTSEGTNALGSLTANMIEKVEVITNPSAKYDAEGTVGIINIVLKKSEKKGLNGSISLNTGIPHNHSIGISVNRRTEKLNLFSQLGYGYRSMPRYNKTSSENKTSGATLQTEGDNFRNEAFFNAVLGADYHFNKLNILTLSGSYAFEDEKEHSLQSYLFTENSSTNTENSWERKENGTAKNPKWQYELQFKKDFKDKKERSLLFSALGRSFSKNKTSSFENTTISGVNNNSIQKARTHFAQFEYTFKLDYTHPFLSKYKLEAGAQHVINNVSNNYEVQDFFNSTWITNTGFSNIFIYNQSVSGLYKTLSYEGDKWGAKAGLRLEYTDLKTQLVNTADTNTSKYVNLFPSFHTSYKLSKNISIQAGYSKRIYRPRLWSLNPFFSFRDNYNIYTGNPKLKPELTNSYEISSIFILKKASLNFNVFHRITNNAVERIAQFNNNITTTKPINIGTKYATGIEFNGKYTPNKWTTFTGDFNYNRFTKTGKYDSSSFEFSGNQWSSRLRGSFKLPAQFTIEITGNYRSQFQSVQGFNADNYFFNLGIRKKMLKGRLNANLGVRDLFATRRRSITTTQPLFNRTYYGYSGRFLTLGLSYGFGKGETMEFSGRYRY